MNSSYFAPSAHLGTLNDGLWFFIFVAYAFTWAVLFPLAFLYTNVTALQKELWHAFGALGPAFAAILTIWRVHGTKELRKLKRRLSTYPGHSLLLFACFPLLILGVAILFEASFFALSMQQYITKFTLTTREEWVIFFLPSVSYGIFEEIGWRGFFLPTLQKKYNALTSTLILAGTWFFWHTPMFFYNYDVFFVPFLFPLLVSGSIVFTYLFNTSEGNLLVVILLHVTYDIVAQSNIGLATILVSTFFVFMDVRIIKVYSITHLSDKERVTME